MCAKAFLDHIRVKKGFSHSLSTDKNKGENRGGINWDAEYNKLADLVRASIDMTKVYEIVLRDGLN